MRVRVGLGLLICCLLATGGCLLPMSRSSDSETREALSRWLYRTQGYVPVFPPREDVQVGDVHLYLEDPDAGRLVTLYSMPRWSALPATEIVERSRRTRAENPETPADYLRTGIEPQKREWPEARARVSSLDAAGPSLRLRSLQLPPFSVTRQDAAELPPALAMILAVDDSQEDWESARIGVESAETSVLALEDAIATFLERRGSRLYLPATLRQNLRALASRDLEHVWLRVVTEVVYMRALRMTIASDPAVLDLVPDDTTAAGLGYEDYEGDDTQDKSAEVDLDPTYAAIARAHAMNAKLIDSGADVLPDSFIRFLRVSDELTTARRVFRRPTAIGVGGLSLEVDARTGEVESFRLMGRNLDVTRSFDDGEEGTSAIDAEPTTPIETNPPAGAAPTAPAAPPEPDPPTEAE